MYDDRLRKRCGDDDCGACGGSVDHFVEMMNEEAAAIGATSSHFMNPHGLTNPDIIPVYDIYLIYNTALKYEFSDIISRKNYYAEA